VSVDIMNLTQNYSEGNGKKRKIALATPFYEGRGWSAYIGSLFQSVWFITKYVPSIEIDFWRLDGDAYVWRARNTIAKRLLESDFDELFFLDSDMEWGVDGMLSILMRDVPIVGAAYPCKNNWEFYSVLIDCNDDGIPDVTEDGLIKATRGIVPTGFMKIKREVFETLAEKFPDDYYDGTVDGNVERSFNFFGHLFEEHVPYGEDTSFCVRCQRAGIPLYVDPNITINHYGIKAWTGNYHQYLCRMPGGSDDPAREHRPGNGGIISPSISQEACA
jgi:hypothetical protein